VQLSPQDKAALRDNLERIRSRISAACGSVGRDSSEVKLVAVTKYAGLPYARALLELGQLDLGENRVDHLISLAEGLSGSDPAPRWHMIGHLQRNKAARVAGHISVLHSLDSLALARKLDAQRALIKRPLAVYVQVSMGGAEGRSGIDSAELPATLEGLSGLTWLRVAGLMGLPPVGPLEQSRVLFAGLRRLLEGAQALKGVRGLSMGMTADLEVAIEEGASVVRVGRALLEGLSSEARRP
jgi:pyridoxal phosphate enzyme (YggS family)